MSARYHRSRPTNSTREVKLPFNWPDGWRTVRASCAGMRTSTVYIVSSDGRSARLFGKSGRTPFSRREFFEMG